VVDLELARGGTVVLLLRELEVPFEDLVRVVTVGVAL
jgi:hypothetical protein